MTNQRAGVLGTGHSYPEGILTNEDLAKMVETSDEWITTRTGIKQRRKAEPDEYTSLFAVRAARQAIERARLDPTDIDLLLCATVTPDQILPSTGCIVREKKPSVWCDMRSSRGKLRSLGEPRTSIKSPSYGNCEWRSRRSCVNCLASKFLRICPTSHRAILRRRLMQRWNTCHPRNGARPGKSRTNTGKLPIAFDKKWMVFISLKTWRNSAR